MIQAHTFADVITVCINFTN